MRLTHPALPGRTIDVPDGSAPSLEASGWKPEKAPKSTAAAGEKASATTAPEGADTPEKESKS